MLNCIYKGKRINAFKIAEESEYEYRKEIKLASSKKGLICEECSSPMVFRNGLVITTHFAHWPGHGEKCEYQIESESLRKCKKIMYVYFRQLYPDAAIHLEYKVLSRRRSDLFIIFHDNQRLVIDIEKSVTTTAHWDEKNRDYKDAVINNLWIVNGLPNSDKERNMPFFEQIMLNESTDGIALFLNHKTIEVTLAKKMISMSEKNNIDHSEVFFNTYPLEKVTIMPDGKLVTGFHDDFQRAEEAFKNKWAESIKEVDWVKQAQSIPETWTPSLNMPNINILTMDDDEKSEGEYYDSYRKINRKDTYYRNSATDTSAEKIKMEGIIKAYIRRASNGETGYVEKLVKIIHNGPDNYFIFISIRDEMKKRSNTEIQEEVCERVLKMAGL